MGTRKTGCVREVCTFRAALTFIRAYNYVRAVGLTLAIVFVLLSFLRRGPGRLSYALLACVPAGRESGHVSDGWGDLAYRDSDYGQRTQPPFALAPVFCLSLLCPARRFPPLLSARAQRPTTAHWGPVASHPLPSGC